MSSFQATKISDYRQETANTVSIAFNTNYSFVPGQYINIEVDLKGEKHRRAYSICSAPYENELRIAVKKIENGTVSVYLNERINKGDELKISEPQGNFTCRTHPNNSNHYLIFGAGSGITPLISIVKSVLHDEPKSQVTLFYGNSNAESIIFKDELNTLENNSSNLKVVHILSDGSLETPLLTGRINFEKAMQLISEFASNSLTKVIYTCGPAEMMQTVKEAGEVSGISQVHMEYFSAPTSDDSATKAKEEEPTTKFEGKSQVKITLDDDIYEFEVPAKGKTILDYCIEEDVDPPYSCRGGVCVSCMAKVEEGKVVMDSNNALTDKELSEGYILTCQAHPASEKVSITFDD